MLRFENAKYQIQYQTDNVFNLPQGDTVYATVMPEVDEKELEKMVNPIVQEYFEHGDTKEVQVIDLFPSPSGFWTRIWWMNEPSNESMFAQINRPVMAFCPPSCQMLLKGLNLGPHKYEFSSLAVSLALEGKASHRELTSRLLSDLSGKLLSQSDMARAFDKMLKELPDLILDTPEAPQVELTLGVKVPTIEFLVM